MDYKEIKKLMDDMGESKLTEVEIEFPDGIKISMKKEAKTVMEGPQEIKVANEVGMPETKEQEDKKVEEKEDNYKKVTAPMVGTYYGKPSPKAKEFVKVGDKVKKGDVLCILEAMKLMNEIESEYDGEIVEICCKDEDMVEYGTVLFKIK